MIKWILCVKFYANGLSLLSFVTKKILPLESTSRTHTELNPWNMILGGGHLGVGLPKCSVIKGWKT